MLKRLTWLFACTLIFNCNTGKAQAPQWSYFKWGHDSVTVNGQRAFVQRSAIFLPVSFDGDPRRYYVQLDLSSGIPLLLYNLPGSVYIKSVMNKPLYPNGQSRCYRVDTVLKGKLGTVPFSLDSAQYCLLRKDNKDYGYYQPPDNLIIGTVGLNYFLKKILIIDFPDGQFMLVTDSAKLPYRFSKAKYYVPAHIENSRFIFPIQYGDTVFNDFFYETGSSIFDMVVSKKLWQKLTGLNGDEKGNFRVKVNSWGSELNAIGARAKLPIRVNNTMLPAVTVFYLPDDEDFKSVYGCGGMIGNSPFYTKAIVLDFINNRLGLFTTF